MPPQSSNNRGELSLESVDKDVGSCFNRVYHCEDDLEELRTAAKEAAKLAVFNARELNQVSSTTKITCFLTGSLKDTVNVAFKAFREEARKAREEKKGKKWTFLRSKIFLGRKIFLDPKYFFGSKISFE